MRLIDTHCHLTDERANPDVEQTLADAASVGVDRVVTIGVDRKSSEAAVALADRFPGVYATVGWHPTYVDTYDQDSIAFLRDISSHPKVVAIGEIGLDFYWDYTSPSQQFPALHAQLDLALELGKPVVFHCRDAYDQLLDLIDQREIPPFVVHCFGGDATHARRVLDHGGYLGVDGPLTYKKNHELRALFAELPAERILIETDSPYLTPEPFRGKQNSPAFVSLVNAKLEEIRDVTLEEMAARTTANAEAFYRLGA